MKQITFELPVEALGNATAAILLGDFNNWNTDEAIALTINQDGVLQASVPLEAGKTYEYRFLLNDGRWVNDWSAQGYVHKEGYNIENSVITVPVEEVAVVEEAIEIVAPKPAKKAKALKSAAVAAKTKKTAKAPAKDDLTKIEGIGPKIAKLLEAEGIVTFKDLSKATSKKLKAIIEAAGPKFRMHDPATWAKQAKLAADDKWEKLLELQATLKGGK